VLATIAAGGNPWKRRTRQYWTCPALTAGGEMAVAYFVGYNPKKFCPLENQGEPAVLFCFISWFMATQVSGIWRVDAARKRREIEVSTTNGRQHR